MLLSKKKSAQQSHLGAHVQQGLELGARISNRWAATGIQNGNLAVDTISGRPDNPAFFISSIQYLAGNNRIGQPNARPYTGYQLFTII
jgi:hypothetical protein